MSVFKLTPAYKDYLWGGTRLKTEFGKAFNGTPLAESWELSCHPDGASTLPSGETFSDYLAKNPKAAGTNCARFDDFPLLIKLIDAENDLSIQVHPANAYALEHEHQYGKTEMWVVVDCVPGAYLYYGFAHDISKEEFAERIQNNTLTEVLNAVEVKPGDVFFIAAGTIHAICAGILIAEIQQNSNVTYRVFDYGRVGVDGKLRDLHLEKAKDVTILTPPRTDYDFGEGYIGKSDYFAVRRICEDGATGNADASSFHSLLILSGGGEVEQADERTAFTKGDSLFVSAGSGAYTLHGEFTLLQTTVPAE